MAVNTTTLEDQAAPPQGRSPDIPYRRMPIWRSLGEVWHARHLLRLFGAFAIRRKFTLTLLGPGWIIVTVAMDIAGKTFLFGGVLNVRTPEGVPYIIFLLAGLLGWTLFQHTLLFGVRSFQWYRKYLDSLHIPLPIIPVAAGAQALLQFVIYLGVIGAGLAYYAARGQAYYQHGVRLLLVPLGLVLCLLFSWGLSFLLAPLNYRKRDVRLLLTYVLMFWQYVTPVVYPLQALHGPLLLAAKLNPLAPMMEMIKFGLIGGGNIGIEWACWGAGCAVATFLIGLATLGRFGPRALARPLMVGADDDDDDLW